MSKYQVIAYVRLSYTEDRSSESNSIFNQKLLIEYFVKHNPEIEIVSVKVDYGFIGVLFDRPAFLEMMDEIKAGRANCILVKDLSRLGREYIETGRYLRRIFLPLPIKSGMGFRIPKGDLPTKKVLSGQQLRIFVFLKMKSILEFW